MDSFILFMDVFTLQKLLSLIRWCLFIFVLFTFALRERFKKIIAAIYVKECFACVFPQEF